MVLKIGLVRYGCKNKPIHRIMVYDRKSRGDNVNLEVLGYFNNYPEDGANRMGLAYDRVEYWLSAGAQPTDSAEGLLYRAGVLPLSPRATEDNNEPTDIAQIDCTMASENPTNCDHTKDGPTDTQPVDLITGPYLTSQNSTNSDHTKDNPTNGGHTQDVDEGGHGQNIATTS